MNDILETLYKTKTPNPFSFDDQSFELSLGEQSVDGRPAYFVRETYCWWDSAARRTVRVQYTLSPRAGFLTFEEARDRYNTKRMERARRGFVHSFIPRFESGKPFRYVRIETAAQPETVEKKKAETQSTGRVATPAEPA